MRPELPQQVHGMPPAVGGTEPSAAARSAASCVTPQGVVVNSKYKERCLFNRSSVRVGEALSCGIRFGIRFVGVCQTTDELSPPEIVREGTSRRILYLPRILSPDSLLEKVGPQDQAARVRHTSLVFG